MARRKKPQELALDEQADSLPESPETSDSLSSAIDALFETARTHPRQDDLVCYLYRTWPIIDRKKTDKTRPKYIDKLTAQCTTRDHIRKAWGSGKYLLSLFDSGSGHYGSRIAQAALDLGYDVDNFPVFEADELVLGVEKNRSVEAALRVRGLLEEGDDMKDSGAAVAQLTNTVTELAGKLSEKRPAGGEEPLSLALQLIERLQAGRPDPLEQAAKLKDLLGGDNKLLFVLLENQTRMTEALLKYQAPTQATGGSLLDQLDTVTTVMEKLGGLSRRGGGGGGGSGWSELVRGLPSIISGVGQVFAAAAAMRAAAPAAGPGPAAPPVPLSSMPGQAPIAPFPPEVPAGPVFDEQTDQVLTMIGVSPLRVLMLAKRAVSAFNRGVSGSQFADGLHATEDDGEQLYNVLSTMGRDQIMGVLRNSPAWPELAARETQLVAWVDDFLAYGSEEGDGGAE